jgi:hypothetical protein
MKKTNYKLLVLNKILRAPFVLVIRLLSAVWTTVRYTAHFTGLGFNAVFNRRNAVRIRKVWRGYKELCSDTGDYMVNLLFFKGKVGLVHFNVPDENADGTLMLREFGDARNVEINYAIENRWLVNGKKLPNGYVLSEIRTQGMTQGYKIAYIKWAGKKLMPYAVPALSLMRRPDDVKIPAQELWTEAQEFPQYKTDPLARIPGIIQRVR